LKAFFDSCAVDAVLEGPHADGLKERISDGRIEAYVGGDVVSELAKTPLTRCDRRLRLMSVIGRLLKPARTSIPIVGGRPSDPTAPMGTSKTAWTTVASAEGQAMFSALKGLGITKLDAVHLVEAALAKADVFVTTDKEDLLGKRWLIKKVTNLEVVSPGELL
jgi:hypothetical protein